ncbi:hypothetical protein [Laspinema palackyanum]
MFSSHPYCFLPSGFNRILYDSLNRSLIFIFKVATSGGCWVGDRS